MLALGIGKLAVTVERPYRSQFWSGHGWIPERLTARTSQSFAAELAYLANGANIG